jgi:hypothetical protein
MRPGSLPPYPKDPFKDGPDRRHRYAGFNQGTRFPGFGPNRATSPSMETKPPIPLAVLVDIQTPDVDDAAHEASLEELGRLVKTLAYEVGGTLSQKREGTGAAALLGSGKLAALAGGTGVVGSMAPPLKSKARQRFEGAAGASF